MRRLRIVSAEPYEVEVRRNPELGQSSEMQVCINGKPLVRISYDYAVIDNATQWALAGKIAQWLLGQEPSP